MSSDVSTIPSIQAGYSSLMLVSLSKIMNETQKAVVKRLFQLGDVNLRAKQVSITFHRSCIAFHTSYITFHTNYTTFHTNYITLHTSYITLHTSYVAFHRSHESFITFSRVSRHTMNRMDRQL